MAFANYDTSADNITVTTSWNEKDLIVAVPGSRRDHVDNVWRLPPAWSSLVTLRGVFADQLILGERLIDWAWKLRRSRIDPSMSIRANLTSDSTRVASVGQLYDFQRAGVEFMLTAGSGLLGDEMGVGKTIELLSLLYTLNFQSLPALVICPNSIKTNWAKETQIWLPDATPYVVSGSATAKRKIIKAASTDRSALVIVNYESVRLFSRLAPYGSIHLKRCRDCDPRHGDADVKPSRCEVHLKELNHIPFTTVVLDEAHRIKEPKALQTRAVWQLCHGESVRHRWAMTGTPIANHPGDLWSIMHAVAPSEFPTRGKFIDRYALRSWNAFGGLDIVGLRPDTRDEFYRLFEPMFRRTLKSMVLDQLPPRVREVRYADMSTAQARAYHDLKRGLKTKTVDGALLIAKNHLVKRTRLMQFAAATVKVDKPNPDDVSTWIVSLHDPSPKLDVFEEVLDELGVTSPMYDGPPVIVSGEYKELLGLAAARLQKRRVRYGLITGDVAPIDRDRALDDLQARRIKVLLFTSRTGGVGLTMTAADTLINLQRSWSLIDERQKEDRNYRIGSEIHDCVRIIDIVTRDTIEEDQVTRLHEKLLRLDEITRDRARLLHANINADVSALDAAENELLRQGIDDQLDDDEGND